MRIFFFSIVPESHMYKSLADKFVQEGHELIFVAPTYAGNSQLVEKNGLKYLYFKSLKMLNIGVVKKGIANLVFPYLCLKALKKCPLIDNTDIILMSTPPLAFYSAVRFMKKRNKNSILYLILRDIHPEGAKFIGLDKYKPIYNYFRKIEKNLYKISDYIGCMSPENIKFVTEKNPQLNPNKLTLLPNWNIAKEYTAPDTNIRTKYDLENRFIVIYGGNMGIPQGLDIFLELASMKREYKDVLFLFVGKGTEKPRLEKKARDMSLDNVRFMDFIPQQDFTKLLKSCDIGLISLHPAVPIPNIPSKTLDYFEAKLPVLASIDAITDYGRFMLDKPNAGLWSLATDINSLTSNFDVLYKDASLRKQMGDNGYLYMMNEFSVDKIYNIIVSEKSNGYKNIQNKRH